MLRLAFCGFHSAHASVQLYVASNAEIHHQHAQQAEIYPQHLDGSMARPFPHLHAAVAGVRQLRNTRSELPDNVQVCANRVLLVCKKSAVGEACVAPALGR